MPLIEPTAEGIARCAAALRSGGVVAVPTETVYGLAADALSPAAVAEVFRRKGRPAENPLIVHVPSADAAAALAAEWPGEAEVLAAEFWPGPLTLVVPKSASVPPATTGGLGTVALRVPRHPVAQRLLAAAGIPLAAPSANRFGSLSPTTAEAVLEALGGEVDVLDGGPCEVGIESTVVDLCSRPARLLRPGRVGVPQLEAALAARVEVAPMGSPVAGPGMYARHYATAAPIHLVEELAGAEAGLGFGGPKSGLQVQMPSDPVRYAALLYSALRELDRLCPSHIAVESVPEGQEWDAVRDRLRRACQG